MSLAYFPMYPTDFDADTGHLSMAEDGAYNRLLRLSWRCPECKMPDDLDWICRKVRAVSEADRAIVQGILAEFFKRKGGKVFSARLQSEWVKATNAHEQRILRASKGGAAKALKAKESEASSSIAQECLSLHNQNQNQNHIDTVAKATDGDAVEADLFGEPDLAKVMFDQAVAYLGRHGVKGPNARAFVGKLRKAHPDHAIIAAMTDCAKAGVVDPVPWISARMAQPPPQSASIYKFDLSKFGEAK